MDPNPKVEPAELDQLDLEFLARRVSVHEYYQRYLGLCRRMAESEAQAEIIEAAAHRECTIDEAELREQIVKQLKMRRGDVSDHLT